MHPYLVVQEVAAVCIDVEAQAEWLNSLIGTDFSSWVGALDWPAPGKDLIRTSECSALEALRSLKLETVSSVDSVKTLCCVGQIGQRQRGARGHRSSAATRLLNSG